MGLQLTHSAASVNAVGFLDFVCVSHGLQDVVDHGRSKCGTYSAVFDGASRASAVLARQALASATVTSVVLADDATKPGPWKRCFGLTRCITMHRCASLCIACIFDPFASIKIRKSLGELDLFLGFCFCLSAGAGCRHQLAGRCLELSMTCSQYHLWNAR